LIFHFQTNYTFLKLTIQFSFQTAKHFHRVYPTGGRLSFARSLMSGVVYIYACRGCNIFMQTSNYRKRKTIAAFLFFIILLLIVISLQVYLLCQTGRLYVFCLWKFLLHRESFLLRLIFYRLQLFCNRDTFLLCMAQQR